MNTAKVRLEVEKFSALGVLPSESSADIELIKQYDTLYRSIEKPITDNEARVLIKLFGLDGCFGLASSLMHLIETAPGWPLEECLIDQSNEWLIEMRNRAIRSGLVKLNKGEILSQEFGQPNKHV